MMSCKEVYPDIYTDPTTVPSSERPALLLKNEERRRLYLAVRALLHHHFSFPLEHIPDKPSDFPPTSGGLSADDKLKFLGVYGLLLSRNMVDPSLGRNPSVPAGPDDISIELPAVSNAPGGSLVIVPRFVQALVDAVKEFTANKLLYERSFPVLQAEGRTLPNPHEERLTVYTRQLAEVVRRLVEERIHPGDPQLKLRILNALSLAIGSKVDGSASSIDISLPDLEAGTAVDIIADNVKALAALYFSAQLEEMKLFAVADRVAEHFMTGMLPLSRGPGGERIYKYIKKAPERFTEVERRSMYARAFGIAQGSVDEPMPNREFSDLWIRFLSAVSMLNRQSESERTLVTEEQALKSACDLATCISVHGHGVAHFAAVELQELVREVKEMLENPDVLAAYGVRDWSQAVERVSTLYLGGAMNGVRYRTMAQAGGEIILWLARNAPLLSSRARYSSGLFTNKNDTLVPNVERWLAVTGTPDSTVEKFSEPMDMKVQPTIPTMQSQLTVPDSVRNALNQVTNGVPLPGLPRA